MSSYTSSRRSSNSSSGSGSSSNGSFNYKVIEKKLIDLQKFLEAKYKKLGKGSYRACYEYSDTQVIKCPTQHEIYGTSDTSVYCNLVEYSVYQEYKRKRIMPKTSLVWMMDVPLIIMDKVDMKHLKSEDYRKFESKLEKHDISLQDGYYQIGRNAKGTLLCADMGNEDDLLTYSMRKRIEQQVAEIYKKLEKPTKKDVDFTMKRMKLLLS
jgi:hypothetical protein